MRVLTIFCSFLISFFSIPLQAQIINFTIDDPQPNSIIDSTLAVNITLTESTYEITSVTVASENLFDTLLLDAPSHFSGSLNVISLPKAVPLWLKIIVKDYLGNEKADSVKYIYVPPPKAIIELPEAGSNAYPSLRIKANINAVDTCRLIVKVDVGGTTIFRDTGYHNIDTTISISSALSGSGRISASVKDKWLQTNTTATDFFADDFLYAGSVHTATGNILDYNYNSVLSVANNKLKISDTTFQTTQIIPGAYTIGSTAAITLYGVVWGTYEWTNNILYNYGNGAALSAGGAYLSYTTPWYEQSIYGNDLYIKNMASRDSVLVGHFTLNAGVNKIMAENGTLFYGDVDDLGLIKYHDGTQGTISEGCCLTQFLNPVTDGHNILYNRHNLDVYTNQVCYYDGNSQTIISDLDTYGDAGFILTTPANYLLSGKFIVYSKPGTSGQLQIWQRDSLNNNTQLTFFSSSSYIEGLTPSGDLLFNNSGRRYYLKKGSNNPTNVGPALGRIVYRDAAWYVINNKYLYKLNAGAYRTITPGNWSNPAIWENGNVPPSDADVLVTTNITVDTNVTCNTLKVVIPGSITVLPGINLSILH